MRDQFRCNSRWTRGVTTHMNVKSMMRVRIWAPFLIGFLGGTLAILLWNPINEFLGIADELLAYVVVPMFAGALTGLVVALAPRTWQGHRTLVLGFVTAGLPYGGLPNGLFIAVLLGLFGVPTYVAVFTLLTVARAPRPPPGPVAGWPPVTPGSIPSEAPEDGPPPGHSDTWQASSMGADRRAE